jgi:predicted aspartyl protease
MRALVPVLCCLGLLALTSAFAHDAEGCRPGARTSFELATDWYGGVYVTAHIGSQRLKLLVDTGGTTSMLTDSTVAALGLEPQPIRSLHITMYGGLRIQKFVRVENIRVGNMAATPATFLVMPDSRLPYELAGTLAPDFLAQYDVDLDFANARMNLLSPDRCTGPGEFLKDGPVAAVPIMADSVHHVIVPVKLDGMTILAVLDTGASRSDLSFETAETLYGLNRNTPGLRPAVGADVEDGLYRYPFKTLTIGGKAIGNPDLTLVPQGVSRRSASAPRLVLGMGILRHYRLYISYSRNLLYLTPADGRQADHP